MVLPGEGVEIESDPIDVPQEVPAPAEPVKEPAEPVPA